MRATIHALPAVLLTMASAAPTLSAASNSLTGSISGVVSSALGIPQMGASVTLYNRLERQVSRVLTDDKGIFQFESLPADVYILRVSLTRFAPAMLGNISVQPGIRRVLSINLASILSNIELVYSLPVTQGLMSEDWKWALRSSLATRPILRILAADHQDPLRAMRTGSAMFTHTRGQVNLSAGEMGAAPTLGSQPDLGTAFALATSFMGSNHFEFAGNLGYSAQSGNPAASFRTAFSRQIGKDRTPEVAVTMRQLFVSGRTGSAVAGGQSAGIPLLRTMSISVNDKLNLSDDLSLIYGASIESVQFLERLNYLSPFAKLSYHVEGLGTFEAGYSSGIPNAQLYARNGPQAEGAEAEEQREISGVALFPRVSLRGGHAQVQRAQNYELGYHRKMGTRKFSAAAYREVTTNAALMAVGAEGAFAHSDVLPGLFSRESVLNGGNFHTMGYMASLQQDLSENWTVTTAYGNSGVLESTGDTLRTDSPGELRRMIHAKRRHWVNTRVSGMLAGTGTRFTTSYQFLNGRPLTAGHFYMTQRHSPEQGLNVYVRQPIPSLGGRSGKLEATAEIRNILAQGYQGINFTNGRRMYLVSTPRALRGGLAFIF